MHVESHTGHNHEDSGESARVKIDISGEGYLKLGHLILWVNTGEYDEGPLVITLEEEDPLTGERETLYERALEERDEEEMLLREQIETALIQSDNMRSRQRQAQLKELLEEHDQSGG